MSMTEAANYVRIIYENTDFLVCEKPKGILTLPAESVEESLFDLVLTGKADGRARAQLFPVHRLDRLTSGLVVFAKTKGAAGALSTIFAEHKNEKEYLCVVHGRPEKESGECTDLLLCDKRANKTYVVDRMRKGVKEARLSYSTLSTLPYKSGTVSLLCVRLHTGRMHQIRAQLSSRGHALLGDGKYGSKENACTVALHASALRFSYKGEHSFSSPAPKEFPFSLFEI